MKKLLVIATLWLPCMLNGMDTTSENSDSSNPDLYLPRPEDTPIWFTLKKLIITKSRLPKKSTKAISKLPKLESLHLDDINDQKKHPLYNIDQMGLTLQSLKELEISNTKIGQLNKSFFKKFPKLEALVLDNCHLSDRDSFKGIPDTICALTKLKRIEIKNNNGNQRAIRLPKEFFIHCNQLEVVNFSCKDRCPMGVPIDFPDLGQCKNLIELNLANCRFPFSCSPCSRSDSDDITPE